jgi:CRISPR-associated protein Csx10
VKALIIQLRLTQPVLAGQTHGGEPNSNVSLPFIPGSTLKGALAGRYSGGKFVDLTTDTKFFQLFLSDQVMFLNAYPVHPDAKSRMLPRPLSWHVHKADVHNTQAKIYDFAISQPEDDETFKAPAGDFSWQGSDTVNLLSPQLEVIVHNASNDRNRKVEGSSQVFRYDALSAGQIFETVILSEDDTLLKDIRQLFEGGDLSLGASRTGGYGKAVVDYIQEDDTWQENSQDRGSQAVTADQVILTCLSDIIIRSPDGAFDFDLETLAGEPPSNTFRRTRLVGGFNNKWGLPIVQAWAIEAGSVFVFPGECRSRLEEKLMGGIGERRNDGFGRFALDMHSQPVLHRSDSPIWKIKLPDQPPTLSASSQTFAKNISDRRLRAAMERTLADRIIDLTASAEAFNGLPKPAQLARYRQVARTAWQKQDLELIGRHYEKLSELSRRSWKDARLKGEPLVEWIRDRANNPALENWNIKEGDSKFAGVSANVSSLQVEFTARLIDGVLKQAMIKAKKEGGAG